MDANLQKFEELLNAKLQESEAMSGYTDNISNFPSNLTDSISDEGYDTATCVFPTDGETTDEFMNLQNLTFRNYNFNLRCEYFQGPNDDSYLSGESYSQVDIDELYDSCVMKKPKSLTQLTPLLSTTTTNATSTSPTANTTTQSTPKTASTNLTTLTHLTATPTPKASAITLPVESTLGVVITTNPELKMYDKVLLSMSPMTLGNDNLLADQQQQPQQHQQKQNQLRQLPFQQQQQQQHLQATQLLSNHISLNSVTQRVICVDKITTYQHQNHQQQIFQQQQLTTTSSPPPPAATTAATTTITAATTTKLPKIITNVTINDEQDTDSYKDDDDDDDDDDDYDNDYQPKRYRSNNHNNSNKKLGKNDETSDDHNKIISKRREQNRRAAKTCREKKKQAAEKTLQDYQKARSKHTALKYELEKLKKRRDQLSETCSIIDRCH